jgi:LPPG:FO 2-phospho-L-lactate transferase
LIVVLAGGVGAARFLEGLVCVFPQKDITIIGNVADDTEIYGLHISPDLDIVAYTLAGLVDPAKGWGFRADTFECQNLLRKYGFETWFKIGDKDLATHIYRTEQLRHGRKLSEATDDFSRRLGLQVRLLPATDDAIQTHLLTEKGWMHFQEYMVKRKTTPRVYQVVFRGVISARPVKGVIESIANASGIIVAPSNPIVSIGAMLAVPRIRSALQETKGKVVAVSPIIGGKTVKGPADKLMKASGVRPTAVGVAELYRDFLDTLILDRVDKDLAPHIAELGIKPVVTDTLMRTNRAKVRLAKIALSELKH